MQADSVGPYIDGSPEPSGTLAAICVPGMAAGSAQTLTVNVANSAVGGYRGRNWRGDSAADDAGERDVGGRLSQVGQTDWFSFPVRGGNRRLRW